MRLRLWRARKPGEGELPLPKDAHREARGVLEELLEEVERLEDVVKKLRTKEVEMPSGSEVVDELLKAQTDQLPQSFTR